MGTAGILAIVMVAGVAMTVLAALLMFCGANGFWNIHKMRQYALSKGGVLAVRTQYGTHHTYCVKMPNGEMLPIPDSVSTETVYVTC